jgi:hypothetical protein
MKFRSEELLNELQQDIKKLIEAAQHIQQEDQIKLAYAPEEGKWSVAQVIEHLNAYGRYYLPAIEKAIAFKSKDTNQWFVPGWFGNYFTNMMKPKNVYEVKNKMKAPKGYAPTKGVNVESAFKEFVDQQNKLLQLLEMSRTRDLNTIRIPITLTKLIKLKLGDVFRFLIAHEQRHMIQARNTLHAVGIKTDKFPVILEAAQL